jgi:hypothetical protein
LWRRYAITSSYFLILAFQSLMRQFFRHLFSPRHKARLSGGRVEQLEK